MPSKKITDYRTQWSGITPESLIGAPPVAEVQKQVAALLEGRVVVGHGLENDFKCLGYFHERKHVRDTAHDLPRLLTRRGRPRKLRKIAWEFLGLTIQVRQRVTALGGDATHLGWRAKPARGWSHATMIVA